MKRLSLSRVGPFFLAGLALTVGGAGRAYAQQGAAIPALPPVTSAPLPPLASPLSPTAPAPGAPQPPSATPAAPQPPSPSPAPAAPPSVWLSRSVAKLQILNKVDATRTSLSIAVGKTETFATLTITVEACLVRPANESPDSAAYLEIKDKNPALTDFHGWLLAAEPAVSVFEHPIYDVRLTSCSGTGVAPARH